LQGALLFCREKLWKGKVLEPDYIVADLKAAAENILENYK